MKRNSEDITNELKAISPIIAEINNENVFQVPSGFFNEFPGKMIIRLKTDEILSADLSANEEIKQLSPLLASLKEKSSFSVPVEYFGTFSNEITGQIHEISTETPVINIKAGSGRWVRYAIAALIAGVVAAGSLLIFKEQQNNGFSGLRSNGGQAETSSVLTHIPDQDLTDYLSSEPTNFEWTSDDSLEGPVNIRFFALDDGAIKSILKEVTYDALQDYETELNGIIPL